MKVVTGDKFNTSFGMLIVHNEQDEVFAVGDSIKYDGTEHRVKAIIPPTKPDGKWALQIG